MSFKFLYIDQNIEKANLEEYFKELNKFDNEEMLINSGLEANLELAGHLIKEIEYLDTVDTGLEDSDKDKKEKDIGFITVIKIIIRLVKVLLRVIGVVGINVFKLIMGKVTGYVSVARKLTNKIDNYMKENNISDHECKHEVTRKNIRFVNDSLVDAALAIAGDYEKGIYAAIKEYLFMNQYVHYVEQISKLARTFNVSKDMERIDEIIGKEGKITEEVIKIVKHYAIDVYFVFGRKPISPFFDRYVLDNIDKFKIYGTFFRGKKLDKHNLTTFFINGFERNFLIKNSKSIRVNFLIYLEERVNELLSLVGKTDKEVKTINDVFVFDSGTIDIKEDLPKPKPFTIQEINKIINEVDSNAKVAEKFSNELMKMRKEMLKFEKEMDNIEAKEIGKSRMSKLILKYVKNNVRTYVEASKYIINYVGRGIGMGIPNNILTEITFGKGVCVGYIDPSEIKNALETETEKIKKEYGKE